MPKVTRSLEFGHAAAALLAVVVGVSACSSDEDCEEDESCEPSVARGGSSGGTAEAGATSEGGSGAQAGADGEGGAPPGSGGSPSGNGGQGGAQACATDDDCDDGLSCNGIEECAGGVCEPGEEHCTNVADPDHCLPSCTESASGPVCGVEPVDADGDGYGDAECLQNPGDDCNDSVTEGADIHPGVDETCNDGVDDDCDGEDETTDDVVLAGSSEVLVAPVGTTERDHVSIAAIPSGGFGVVWADRRAGTEQNVFYRHLLASGAPGAEIQLTTDAAYFNNDYPDIGVLGSSPDEFYVAHQAQKEEDSDGLMLGVEVKFDATATENPVIVGESYSRPQVSYDTVYYAGEGTDQRASFCGPSGGGCNSWCCEADAFYAANTLHASPLASQVVYEHDGDLFLRDLNNFTPSAVAEGTPENRTNPLLTENGSQPLLAYRYDDGIRVGGCEFADGIPIDLATTGSEAVLLYWNPEQTAVYVRVVSPDCATSASALVAEEDGTSIGSAAVAVDSNGVIAAVWSSEDTTSGEWTIMSRVFTPALCQ